MKMNVPPEQEASPQGTLTESGASPALTKTQAARRRILGATLGAPVIYTLPSGTLQAARSNFCENNVDSALDSVKVQKIENGETVTYRVVDQADQCFLYQDGLEPDWKCNYQGKTWVYDGDLPTETDVDNAETGRLVTQSCWTSMGTDSAGTNWVNFE